METFGALRGIRVIDWAQYHQGPAAGMLLAELGADVIHVEQRGHGDLMRGQHTMFGANMILPSGHQVLVEDLNKNKRSLSLDLAKARGKELMYHLVEESDVFLTNMRPQAVRKLGMDYQTLSQRNPRIVWAQATSCGERGPEKDSPGLEPVAYARSGSMLAAGEEGWPPVFLPSGSGDRIGGLFLAFGIVVALLHRERTGVGQELYTSQLGAMVNLQAASVITTLLTGVEPRAHRREKAKNPLYNWYKCQDGRWIILAMAFANVEYWPSFCQALDRSDLIDDPRFCSGEKRAENGEQLVALLDEVFATRPCEVWERRLRQRGDMIFSRVNSLSDLATDPQILANDYLVDFDHPALGPMKHVALPISFSKTPAHIHSPAPEYGQHTEEILGEVLGLSWDEISKLHDEEVV